MFALRFQQAVWAFTLVFTSAASPALAQPVDEGKYTLTRIVGLAAQNNRLLGSQDARVEGSRSAAMQARAWAEEQPAPMTTCIVVGNQMQCL